jgi:cytidine deaminase
MDVGALLTTAREAQERAIAPYSEYEVGAAIATTDGVHYGGCNFEVANYSNSLHAECVALVRALFEGERSFEAIAVTASGPEDPTPCGLCRQTLSEYCDGSLGVYVDTGTDVEEYRLDELLPAAFSGADLD